MATKKDLVEAYAFSRRRLVTAFVSGAPGGREVEPARPGRTVVAGVALAVLLIAGAAVAGVFDNRDPVDWDEEGLVVDADSGALYVILADDVPGFTEPRVRSVVNVTSAQLILGSEVEAQEVSGEEIGGEPKGPPVGIIGAPATVPGAGDLINTGWTSCTGEGYGVRTDVSGEADVQRAPGAGLVVSTKQGHFLIATSPSVGEVPETARSYALPRKADDLANDLGVDLPQEAIPVAQKWLDLFPVGAPLDAQGLGLPAAGEKPPAAVAADYPAKARIGDYFVGDDGRAYVITVDGALELSEFARDVLEHTELGGRRPREVTPTSEDWTLVPDAPEATHWPTSGDLEDATDPGEEVCAVLDAEPGVAPAVEIGLEPGEDTSAAGSDDPAESDAMDEVTVLSGHGAVVRRGGWSSGEGGAPHLVDDLGMAYLLRGDAVDLLGYGGVPGVVVPDQWLELFGAGPELSHDAALCPPTTDPEARCE